MYARDPRRTEYWGLTLRVSGLCLRHFDAKLFLHPSPSTLLGATRSVARSSTDAAALMHFFARRHAIMLTQPMDGADFAAVSHPKPPPAWTATAIHGAGLV